MLAMASDGEVRYCHLVMKIETKIGSSRPAHSCDEIKTGSAHKVGYLFVFFFCCFSFFVFSFVKVWNMLTRSGWHQLRWGTVVWVASSYDGLLRSGWHQLR